MSKEQTPITAEAIARSFLDPCTVNPKEIKDLEKYIEQYTKAKVLEALENLQFNIKGLAHDEIYWLIETEVKPKYKL